MADEPSAHLNITAAHLSRLEDWARNVQLPWPEGKMYLTGTTLTRVVAGVAFERPLRETFGDFLLDHLKYCLGSRWGKAQLALPDEQRHVVMRWFFSLEELKKASFPTDHRPGQIVGFRPSGDTLSLASLADDLFRLHAINALPNRLLKRIRIPREFQGARYEASVAAALARAGFEIQWLTDKSTKHPEFIATHSTLGEQLAVEVKSRHRSNVLHHPGRPVDLAQLKADVGGLYAEALEQLLADIPSAIFIDVNLPYRSAGGSELGVSWSEDVKRMLEEFTEESTPTAPAKELYLGFTNFAWHYNGPAAASAPEVISTFPKYVRRAFNNPDMIGMLLYALNTFGNVPTYR
jgi:hypothetical protein